MAVKQTGNNLDSLSVFAIAIKDRNIPFYTYYNLSILPY
jgi:hypothetical protein